MYKAITNIGDFKVGDIVPDSLAETWLSMYAVPPVEKVEIVEKQIVKEDTKVEVSSDKVEVPKKKVFTKKRK